MCIEEVVTKKMNAAQECDLAAHVGDDPVNESLDPGPNCGPKLSTAASAPAYQAYHLPPLAESSISLLPNNRRPRVTLQDKDHVTIRGKTLLKKVFSLGR